MIVGNVVIAFLLAFSVLIIGIFDIFPATDDSNRQIMGDFFSILKDYAIFAFVINFIREVVKDCQDYEGDFSQQMQTLPIVIGLNKTSKILSVLIIFPVIILLIYIYNQLMINQLYFSVLYSLIFIVAPLIFCSINLWTAKDKIPKKIISFKIVLIFANFILSFAVHKLILQKIKGATIKIRLYKTEKYN